MRVVAVTLFPGPPEAAPGAIPGAGAGRWGWGGTRHTPFTHAKPNMFARSQGKTLHCRCHCGMAGVQMWLMAMAQRQPLQPHMPTTAYFTAVQTLPIHYWIASVVM